MKLDDVYIQSVSVAQNGRGTLSLLQVLCKILCGTVSLDLLLHIEQSNARVDFWEVQQLLS